MAFAVHAVKVTVHVREQHTQLITYKYIRGKYKPADIRFSYLENAILGILKAEILRNIFFTLNIVSVTYRQ